MRVTPEVFDDAAALGEAAAGLVIDRVLAHQASARSDGPFVLGSPSGRSVNTTYQALARQAAEQDLDLSGVRLVMMDEYVVDGPDGLRLEDPDAGNSCARFVREELLGVVNAGLPAEHQLRADNVWFPSVDEPADYDRRIADAGGIDLFLLATGASDGHVAFNPPGTPADAVSRIIELPEATRRDNLNTFPSYGGDLSRVPTHGLSVGVATIRDQSREVLMLVPQADKTQAAARLRGAEHYEPDWPSTIVVDCRNPHIFLVKGL